MTATTSHQSSSVSLYPNLVDIAIWLEGLPGIDCQTLFTAYADQLHAKLEMPGRDSLEIQCGRNIRSGRFERSIRKGDETFPSIDDHQSFRDAIVSHFGITLPEGY